MNAQEYLNQINMLDTKIRNKTAELETYRNNLYSMRTSTDYGMKVQHSYDEDKITNLIGKITQAEDDINTMIDSLIEDKEKIINLIDRIDDADIYDVIHMRYVQYKTFSEIQKSKHYSDKWVYVLHRRGLKIIEKLIS